MRNQVKITILEGILVQGLGFYKYSYTIISKLITCFIVGFTSKMISQSIAYLLNGSEHIY